MVQREAFTSPFILSPIPTTLGDPQHATVRHPRVPLGLRELLHAHVLIRYKMSHSCAMQQCHIEKFSLTVHPSLRFSSL